MISRYYRLTKPGIVRGNVIVALAAYVLAAGLSGPSAALALVSGLALVVASACVFNNVLDRDIDARMERTKARPLPAGTIAPRSAVLFGIATGVLGGGLLLAGTTTVAFLLACAGFAVYVLAYTPLKRRTTTATFVGALAGAMPPVIGYTAASGRIDATAWWLFLALVAWQMAHFEAIALYRQDEYAAADMPISARTDTPAQRVALIRGYIVSFAIIALAPVLLGAARGIYIALALASVFAWAAWALARSVGREAAWARAVFVSSLLALLIWCIAIASAGIMM